MRTLHMISVAAIASCLLVSCSPKQPDMATLRKAVSDFNAASKASLEGGDMSKPLSFFADDGMEMPPNMAAAKGKEAIKVMWAGMLNSPMKMSNVEFAADDVQASGDIGYEIGRYRMTISGPGMSEMNDSGKFVTIWHYQPDGSWKLRAETWNTDMPMPSMDKPDSKKK